jgi:hypothetical protein
MARTKHDKATLATDVLKKDFGYIEINTGEVVAQLLGIPPVPKTSRHDRLKLPPHGRFGR